MNLLARHIFAAPQKLRNETELPSFGVVGNEQLQQRLAVVRKSTYTRQLLCRPFPNQRPSARIQELNEIWGRAVLAQLALVFTIETFDSGKFLINQQKPLLFELLINSTAHVRNNT